MLNILRKVLPLKGHKSLGMRVCFEVNCECGWNSCAHSDRREAWSEYRHHLLSHGAEQEPFEKAYARADKEAEKLRRMCCEEAPS